ncbi:MAG: STAS domain-containing protein [Verrucomicrobiales bacterium]|nr:STAS domain-containing protein [Verrucomicrobiales bacterium]
MSNFTILVKQEGDVAFARIIGKGSFKHARLLKNYAEQARADGARRFILDLRECAHMDSTFMGVIAGVALAQRRAGAPLPRIVNSSPRALELLHSLGLGQLLDIDPSPCQPISFSELEDTGGSENKAEVTQTMLEAHETLIHADHANAAKFQDVITFLKNKLDNSPSHE